MKCRWMLVALTLIILCLNTAVTAQTTTTNSIVSGVVINTDSLYSIPNVNVILLDANKDIVYRTVTNQNGRFTIANVVRGSYYIRTVIRGYKVMISKMFDVAGVPQKYNYELKIRKLGKGEVEMEMDYYDYLDFDEDLEIIVFDK